MFKLSMEKLTESLREMPKDKKAPMRSKGYKYLYDKMCLPTLQDPDIRIKLDFERFSMS